MKLRYFVLGFMVLVVWSGAVAAQTFTNSTAITIADFSTANPYPSSIAVTGTTGNVSDVNVRINGLSHTFPDDVAYLLVSPSGARMVIQSDVGGGTDVVGLNYTLDDQAATAIPNSGPMPAAGASARPSSVNDDDLFPPPAPVDCLPAGECNQAAPAGTATLNGVFSGATANGTWSLFVIDQVEGDEGMITGGWSLIITAGGGGGTPTPTPTPAPVLQHVVDYDGDGRTDASVVRGTGGGQVTWFHDLSSNNTPAGVYQQQFGTTADEFVPTDYDGDGRSDIAVWRAGPPFGSYFYIFQSMTNTLRIDQFGQEGDVPNVTADYTGDGRADPAVYRDGTTSADRSFWYYRASSGPLSGQIVGTQFGQGGDFPAPGNYNGDTMADFCVQRSTGGGQGVFIRRNGTGGGDPGGAATSVVVFGAPLDRVVPGDYDGDGMTDIATVRLTGGQFLWSIRFSSNSSVFTQFWGVTGDRITQGDYNGDGRTDLAIWRPNADPTQNFFFPFSIPGGKLAPIEWGQMGDYPVANYNVH